MGEGGEGPTTYDGTEKPKLFAVGEGRIVQHVHKMRSRRSG